MLKNLVQELLRGAETAQAARLQANIEAAARRAAAGDHSAAVELYRDCLDALPQDARLWCNLGAALSAGGDAEQAERAYRRALELDTDLAHAWYNLGQLQQQRGSEEEAERCYRNALALPEAAQDRELRRLVHNNLGLLLLRQARLDETAQLYRTALAADPADARLRSNLLFLLTAMPEVDADELLREHRAWGALHAREHAPHPNPRDPERRLRIGYVSADFYGHPLAFHLLPLLANRDRALAETYCYCNGAMQDAMTERLRQHADRWRDIWRLDDAAAEALVRADRIDILVDLSGHTAGNRLTLFARKPAPLQLTMLGYANTTGLDAIDYRVTDAYADPPGAEPRYVEGLLRMPHSLWCYAPQQPAPPENPAPLIANGYVTFASFNGAYKLNRTLIEVWARIFHAVPGSRLLLANLPAGGARDGVLAWFGAAGIDRARLELHARLSTGEYWEAHRRADLALDPFPCTGGATTCEALWLGVPVITLAGRNFAGRAGVSLLSNCGLAQLIAGSREHYVALAVGLAREPQRLVELRRKLQQDMPASPLLDGGAYARALEAHYRGIWRRWCADHA